MSVYTFSCRKGGVGVTEASLLLAYGLVAHGRDVLWVQVDPIEVERVIAAGRPVPFAVDKVALTCNWAEDLLETILPWWAKVDDVVIDLPAALRYDGRTGFEATDVLLIPARPDWVQMLGTLRTWRSVRRAIGRTDVPARFQPWILPVGWEDTEDVVRAVRWTFQDDSGAVPLSEAPVLPWSVPSRRSGVIKALYGENDPRDNPDIVNDASRLATMAIKLVEDPAPCITNLEDLFGPDGVEEDD